MARILVAENDEALRSLYELILQDQGFDVEAVCDGTEALETITRTNPDLVLTEIEIPGGYELCKQLRKQGYGNPIWVCTGMAQLPEGLGNYVNKIMDKKIGVEEEIALGLREMFSKN